MEYGIPCSVEHFMKFLLSEMVPSGVDYYVIGVAENTCAISFRIPRFPTEIFHGVGKEAIACSAPRSSWA